MRQQKIELIAMTLALYLGAGCYHAEAPTPSAPPLTYREALSQVFGRYCKRTALCLQSPEGSCVTQSIEAACKEVHCEAPIGWTPAKFDECLHALEAESCEQLSSSHPISDACS